MHTAFLLNHIDKSDATEKQKIKQAVTKAEDYSIA